MSSGSQISTIEVSSEQRACIDIHVENLSYRVNELSLTWWQKLAAFEVPWECGQKDDITQVLDNVTFSAKSGKLVAVMGSSGSGKTTLLDVIACRTESGETTGDIYFNTTPRTESLVQACTAYVRQDDRLLAHLTVLETLMFVARLKLPKHFTPQMTENRVHAVLSELGLSHVANTIVGDAESRGVSGGERRRVSIGIQLLLDPSILLLDEPTSGLDSFTAHHLMETLSNLAKNNRTVLLSIHQPRSDIFALIDQILILSRGKTVYFGTASSMIDYFTGLGYPCPPLTNPCEFYVDLATIDNTSEETEVETTQTSECLVQAYRNLSARTSPLFSSTEIGKSTDAAFLDMCFRDDKKPGFSRQFNVLSSRSIRNIMEDYSFLAVQVVEALLMSIVVGLVYYDLGLDQIGMRDHFGMMYIMSAMYPYMIVLEMIGQCHKEKRYIYFELQDGLYSRTAHYFSKIVSELPFHTLFVTVYSIPAYFLAGLQDDIETFMKIYTVLYLVILCGRFLAMFAAALLPTYQISCFFAQSIFSICIMSAGFFINLNNIFSGLKWVSTVSYLKWAFQGMCLTEIKNLNFTCEGRPVEYCIHSGEDALKYYGLDGNSYWEVCTGITTSIVVFAILYLISLMFIKQKPHEI